MPEDEFPLVLLLFELFEPEEDPEEEPFDEDGVDPDGERDESEVEPVVGPEVEPDLVPDEAPGDEPEVDPLPVPSLLLSFPPLAPVLDFVESLAPPLVFDFYLLESDEPPAPLLGGELEPLLPDDPEDGPPVLPVAPVFELLGVLEPAPPLAPFVFELGVFEASPPFPAVLPVVLEPPDELPYPEPLLPVDPVVPVG